MGPNDTTQRATLAMQLPATSGQAAAPDWILLVPAGTSKGADGRGPWHLREPNHVIAHSMAAAAGNRLPIDYDHAIDLAAPEGRPAPAAGWITAMETREGAIWGRVDWTEDGARAVQSRHYSFISPVFTHGKADGVIARVVRASLTNSPNMVLTALNAANPRTEENDMDEDLVTVRQALGLQDDADGKAIAAHATVLSSALSAVRQALRLKDDVDPAGIATHATTLAAANETHKTALAAVRQALGKGETASADDLVAAIQIKGATNDELKGTVTALQAKVDGLAKAERDRALDALQAQGKITPAERDHFAKIQAGDPETFKALMAARPAVLKPGAGEQGQQQERGAAAMTPEATQVAQRMGIDPKAFEATLKADAHALAG